MRYLKLSIIAGLVLSGISLFAGEVTGTVKWDDKVPKMRPLNMDADPVCQGYYGDNPAVSEMLVLGEGNTLANIFVRITSGLPDKKFDPPSEPAVLDQKGCMYLPHVMGVMKGQKVKILNSDGVLHNVNAKAKKNRGFNLGMPKGGKDAEKVFTEEEHMIVLKCNVHPWMTGYLAVMAHPFYSVTGKDGKFSIKNLPPGDYEIEAWHERAGTRTGKVTISGADDVQTVDFSFARPKKK